MTELIKKCVLSISIIGLALFANGCAINNETVHGSVAVDDLSEDQLIEEAQSISTALGARFNKVAFLAAIMPSPSYELVRNYGDPTSPYTLHNRTAGAEALVILFQLVNQSKIHLLQERGNAIIAKFNMRVEQKRRSIDEAIQEFLSENPDLAERRPLLTAIVPWVMMELRGLSDAAILEETGKIARGLRTAEFKDVWYGTFSQFDQLPNGTLAWSNFVKANVHVEDNVLVIEAKLGTGEEVSVQGMIIKETSDTPPDRGKSFKIPSYLTIGQAFKGVVINKTAGLGFECTGTITYAQLTASYKGKAHGRTIEGTAVLLR
jgi:hypothetical protein